MARVGLYVAAIVVLVGVARVVDASVAEILHDYGLPAGLLPAIVKSYSLGENGNFEVDLSSTCTATVQDQVYYGKKITGQLSFGQITDLQGIQAKELFFWVPVTGIVVDKNDAGLIWFEVGFVSKSLSVDLFKQPPNCQGKSINEVTTAMSFSDWISKALSGDLDITMVGDLPRKFLQ